MALFIPPFSTIYMEEEVFAYPLTKKILELYPDASLIPIKHYKDIFNRPQDFQAQKNNPKVILAVKKDHFFYEGSEKINNFGGELEDLYYNDQVRNCIYNCDYCILQAMHPSSYTLIYVNTDDFINAVIKKSQTKKMYLSLSYVCDLLAYEGITSLIHQWRDTLDKLSHSNLTLEVRTKTDFFQLIEDMKPHENLILSWSISPKNVCAQFEKGTASLGGRLFAARKAMLNGFKVRLCFDPILKSKTFKEEYEECIKETFKWLDPNKIDAVVFGFFRMNEKHFKTVAKMQEDSLLFQEDFVMKNSTEGSKTRDVSYNPLDEKEMKEFFLNEITKYIKQEKVFFTQY